ncbi:Uncharacterised protein [Mycolicibacterium vanbaalenii]|uniref:Uncharacterized protein n=1 Tax=Mycolicibacterium vanbaalenii TaxID=110539 RepID=A0A5S9R8V0_MYCVN|nr:Uncharacterised protein [Mycolicibacterium vanbaalenii]
MWPDRRGNMGSMLHKAPTRWKRPRRKLLTRTVIRLVREFAAGVDAGHAIAHGMAPPPDSAARAKS